MISIYNGIVTRNNDPDRLGRIRCRCRELIGGPSGVAGELPFWIEPAMGALGACIEVGAAPGDVTAGVACGWFWVPEVGGRVLLEVHTSDRPVKRAAERLLDAPRFRYRPTGYAKVARPDAEFTGDSYPRVRGFRTPAGHIVTFDDQIGRVTVRHASGSQWVEMDETGVTTIEAPRVNVGLGEDDAHNYLVRGDELLAWMVDWLTNTFNLHIHGTGVGPSGPPSPQSLMPDHDSFLSDKHYVE